MIRRRMRTAGLVLLSTTALGCAELTAVLPVLNTILSTGALDEQTVAAGLREALKVGTDRASTTLSQQGGFSDNSLLRLALPSELDSLARTLRTVGLGGQIDSLELAMNRAAERAAGEALPVFVTAIQRMTLQDAFDILYGAPDAATRYFEARTTDELTVRFAPVVGTAMKEVGVYAIYQGLADQYAKIPFVKPPVPNLEQFVTDRALSGLFSTLAEEEAKIRDEPTARSTALLQRVFADTTRPAPGGPGDATGVGVPSGGR